MLACGSFVCLKINVGIKSFGNLFGSRTVGVCLTANYGDRNGKIKVILPPRKVSVHFLSIEVNLGISVNLISVCKSMFECNAIFLSYLKHILRGKIGIAFQSYTDAKIAVTVFFRLLRNQLKGRMLANHRNWYCKSQFLQYHDLGIYSLKLYVARSHFEGSVLQGGIVQFNFTGEHVPTNERVTGFGIVGGNLNGFVNVGIGNFTVGAIYFTHTVLNGYCIVDVSVGSSNFYVFSANYKCGGRRGGAIKRYTAALNCPRLKGLAGNRCCCDGDLVTHFCSFGACRTTVYRNCIGCILVGCYDLNVAKNARERCGRCRSIGKGSLT